MIVAALALTVQLRRAIAQASPNASVFQVLVWRVSGEHFETSAGTGFFVAADGTALTASHVVYDLTRNHTYHLAAIIGGEVYDAALICASPLTLDPRTTRNKAQVVRDVAEIRIVRSSADSVGDLTYNGRPYAHQHHGPIPRFPFLRMARPHEGDDVRTFGFGRRPTAPMPYPWSASGTVERLMPLTDGTPGVEVRYVNPIEPGHSGSPVLNARSEVIGMLDWRSDGDRRLGTAVSSAALDPACP